MAWLPLFAVDHALAVHVAPSMTPLTASTRLVTSYSACVALLLDEISDTGEGDEIDLGIYLIEGGTSSERVLGALAEAGMTRGVRVNFGLDVSYVSMISRIIEKTDTLIPRVAQLAAAHPGWCTCTWGSKPDHSKFAIFTRRGDARADSAILGGINFGDRFEAWDDFAVRLDGPPASTLRRSLRAPAPYARAGHGRVRTWMVAPPSVESARTVAIASPIVALATTTTTGLLLGTLGIIVPLTAISADAELLTRALAVTVACGVVASLLGAAFATACDSAPFSLPREVAAFLRSLIWDRSAAGDTLAPLRRLYLGTRASHGSSRYSAMGTRGAECDVLVHTADASAEGDTGPVGEWRYLPPAAYSAEVPVQFACNRRDQRRYEVEPTFRALFSDTTLTHYRVVMAYLGHRWGVEMLELALRRGARVDLLLPARSNVYANENLRAAQTLIDGRWPTLRLFFSKQMVHAKATLARQADGSAPVAFLGSANLVRGSMNLPVHCGLLPCAHTTGCPSRA